MTPGFLIVCKNVKTLIGTVTDKPTFFGRLPKDPTDIPTPPYSIIYLLPSPALTGPPLVDPDEDADLLFQVTYVGEDANGALWLADRGRAAMVGKDDAGAYLHALDAGDALKIERRKHEGSGGTDEVGGKVTFAERYSVSVTPVTSA